MSALGDNELRIEFTERPTLAVWPHSPGLAPVMPRHVWESSVEGIEKAELYALDGMVDVGGGPLALSVITDSLITSIANPGYPSRATPDFVEYHIYADEFEAVAALGEGVIDSILSPKGLTVDHLKLLEEGSPVTVEKSPANGVRYLGFNLNREPMSDPAFRSSLALLLDRDGLAASNPAGGSVAQSFVSESNPRWFDPESVANNASLYEGELASRLETALGGLREAGYSWVTEPTSDNDGEIVAGTGLEIGGVVPSPLTILTSGDTYDSSRPLYAAEIAETLRWFGFEVRPVETDFDSVVDLTFTPGDDGVLHYDMYLLGWSLGSPALPGYYRLLFASDGVMNNTGYSSNEFTKQLETYEGSYTFNNAREALWTMERTLATDLPYLLLYTSEITEAYRSDRVVYGVSASLGGIQGRLGGIGDVSPVS
jgi:ABC-type transport system substrate-binding protein